MKKSKENEFNSMYEMIKESENALKIDQKHWIYLQTTEFGGMDYSYKVGLLINVDESDKKFRVGLMIGPGDSLPASPIPCYLNEKDSLSFASKWLSNKECEVTYALNPSTKEEFNLIKKLIKKNFGHLVQEINVSLNDGYPYYDRIVPNEIELVENTIRGIFDCRLPERLSLYADEYDVRLECEAGVTGIREDFRTTDFSMLLWSLFGLGFNAA